MRSGDGKQTAFFAANDNRICEPVFVVEHDDITEEGAKVVDANMKLLRHAGELLEALGNLWAASVGTSDEEITARLQARLLIAKVTGESVPSSK